MFRLKHWRVRRAFGWGQNKKQESGRGGTPFSHHQHHRALISTVLLDVRSHVIPSTIVRREYGLRSMLLCVIFLTQEPAKGKEAGEHQADSPWSS